MKKEPENIAAALTDGWKEALNMPIVPNQTGAYLRAPRRWRPLVACLMVFGFLACVPGASRFFGVLCVALALLDYFFGGKREVRFFRR